VPKSATALKKKLKTSKKKAKRQIEQGIVHIISTFNNTIITVTDIYGAVLSWATPKHCGYKGARKSTPFAAQKASEVALKKAIDLYGLKQVQVKVKGPGPGREAAIRPINALKLKIVILIDRTPLVFNGVRNKKKRRV